MKPIVYHITVSCILSTNNLLLYHRASHTIFTVLLDIHDYIPCVLSAIFLKNDHSTLFYYNIEVLYYVYIYEVKQSSY